MSGEVVAGLARRPVAESPVVTIVIPLYNGGRFIRATLLSVVAQEFQRFEVIVVDDGSEDDGPQVVRALSDPRIRLVSSPHLGVAEARNTGASLASTGSSFLVFLDADDLWQPRTLEQLIGALERRPDAAGAFVLADYIDDDGKVLRPGDFPRHMRGRLDLQDGRLVPRDTTADVRWDHLFLANLVYPPSCLLIRRTAFLNAGGFDGRFLAEDWEFVVRLARQGPLVPIDRVLAGYRRHDANASGDRARNVRGARQVWAKVYHAGHESDEERRRTHAVWRAYQARKARRKLAEARALVAQGRIGPGISRAAESAVHAVLRNPLRCWMPRGATARGLESRPVAVGSEARS